jgi:Kdo2-lipid IVA lauroyltransferase/acyltransferase
VSEHSIKDIPQITYEPAKKKDYLEFFLLKVFSILWNIIPEKLAMFFSSKLSSCVKIFFTKRNDLALEKISKNLAVNNDSAQRILSEAYINFACNWVAMVRSQKITVQIVKEHMNLIGFKQFEELKKQGRGAIVANMHLGWWEISPRIFHLLEIPLAVMVAVQHNPLSDKFINHYRSQGGYHSILHNRLSVRHTLRFLKSGGFLVIVADIDAGKNGIVVPFLGEKSSTSNWPAQLALKTDSPIIVGINYCDENKKRTFEMQEAIDPRDFTSSSDSIHDITLAMNNNMSSVIERFPGQWFWLQRRWKSKL